MPYLKLKEMQQHLSPQLFSAKSNSQPCSQTGQFDLMIKFSFKEYVVVGLYPVGVTQRKDKLLLILITKQLQHYSGK